MTRRGLRAAAAALLLAPSAAGCSAPWSRAALRGDLAAVRAGRSEPAPSPFGLDEPGIVHCHTHLSHDSPAPLEQVVEAARRTGVRWVCLTDHTNPAVGAGQPRGLVGGVLVVPGEEMSVGGASVLALGASRSIPRHGQWFGACSEEVRALGGVPIYGHVTTLGRPTRMLADGIAVYDLSDDYRRISPFRAAAVLSCLASADPETSAEAYLLFVQERPVEALALWDAWLAGGPCAGVAEADTHGKFRLLGTAWDPFESLFGLARNHALVPALDEASLLEAIRRGRVAIGFDAAADIAGARFEAWRGEAPAAAMGDAVPLDPALSLVVHLPLPGTVRVLRDGKPWRSGRGRMLAFPVEGTGVYRAEADLAVGGRERPWVIFNPVRVTEAAGR